MHLWCLSQSNLPQRAEEAIGECESVKNRRTCTKDADITFHWFLRRSEDLLWAFLAIIGKESHVAIQCTVVDEFSGRCAG